MSERDWFSQLRVNVVRLLPCSGPESCGAIDEGLTYEGECGCWAFKCCLCGNVGYGQCASQVDDHWDDFENSAIWLTEGGWRG